MSKQKLSHWRKLKRENGDLYEDTISALKGRLNGIVPQPNISTLQRIYKWNYTWACMVQNELRFSGTVQGEGSRITWVSS